MSELPLLSPEAWREGGIWIRDRSGPTSRSYSGKVGVSMWHRIGSLSGPERRPTPACGYGPRGGYVWPGGGLRWEVARPASYGSLPGAVCPRCLGGRPTQEPIEEEVLVPDGVDLETLVELVAERLTAPGGGS